VIGSQQATSQPAGVEEGSLLVSECFVTLPKTSNAICYNIALKAEPKNSTRSSQYRRHALLPSRASPTTPSVDYTTSIYSTSNYEPCSARPRLCRRRPEGPHPSKPRFTALPCYFVVITGARKRRWLARHWWAGPRRRKEPMAFLPVSEYQPPHNDDDSTEDDTSPQICNICLMDLQPGDDVCIGPVCSHVFHDACIHEWLLYSTLACPNCRQSMW
jgi:hypothetical protein